MIRTGIICMAFRRAKKMSKQLKWFIAVLAAMVLFCAGAAAEVSSASVLESGTCGANLTWELDDSGTLTISGTGDMDDFELWDDSYAWRPLKTSISSIIIKPGVTSIGQFAFAETNVTNVSIPDGVTSIGDAAFTNCGNLTALTIPDSVTGIGESAFQGSKLTSITIPANVASIGEAALTDSFELESIQVSGDNAYFASVDGVLFNKDKTTIITYPSKKEGDYTIPDGVTSIGKRAFCYCRSLTGITIPDGVTEINDNAFAMCSALTSINIPASVINDIETVFYGCSSLENIFVDDDNAYYASEDGVFFDKNKTRLILYPNGKDWDSYTIPDGVTVIEGFAFDDGNLTSITIPVSVSTIKDYAVYCPNLTDVYYGGTEDQWNAITMGEDNESLTRAEIHYSESTQIIIASGTCGDNLTWTLDSNGLLTISGTGEMMDFGEAPQPWETYYNSIAAIQIEDGVTSISSAFVDYHNLTSVTIPDTVTSIGEYAFSFTELTNVSIPRNVASIGDGAFSSCTSLTGIQVDSSNEHYCSEGGVLFNKSKTELIVCPATKAGEYTIPNSVNRIGKCAFYDCRNLNKITIPEGVTRIDEWTFCCCQGLEDITIQGTVTEIGLEAFAGCQSLTDVYYSGTKEQWNSITKDEGNASLTTASIHCSDGSIAPHLAAPVLTNFNYGSTIGQDAYASFRFPEGTVTQYIEFGYMDESLGFIDLIWTDDSKITALGYLADKPGTYCIRAKACSHELGDPEPEQLKDSEWETLCFELSAAEMPVIPEAGVQLSLTEADYGELTEPVTYTIPGAEAVTFQYQGENIVTGEEEIGTNPPTTFEEGSTGEISEGNFVAAAYYRFTFWARYDGTWSKPSEQYTITINPLGILDVPTVTYKDTIVGDALSIPASDAPVFTAVCENAEEIICELEQFISDDEWECIDWIDLSEGSLDLSGYSLNEGTYRLRFFPSREGWSSSGPKTIILTIESNINWSLENGVLTISGTGDMPDYSQGETPWYNDRSLITKAIIEDGVTGIGQSSFDSCSNLSEVSIPDTVTSIGNMAFFECSGLTDVTIPDSVTRIGFDAFQSTGLTSVTIPAGVTSMGYDVFAGCKSLTSINVDSANLNFSSENGVLFNKNMTTLDTYPAGKTGYYIIPDGVTYISDFAFDSCSGLTGIVIPVSVSKIDYCAFGGCVNLADVWYYGSREQWPNINIVTDDGGNNTLLNAELHFILHGTCGENLTWVLDQDGVLTISGTGPMDDYSWDNPLPKNQAPWRWDARNITSIVIGDGVTHIGERAFWYATSLPEIAIPAGVTSIGDEAFEGCSSLTNIIVDSGNTAFSSENGVLFNYDKTKLIACPGGKKGEYAIPDGVTAIGNYAFAVCMEITDLTIPDSVAAIGQSAFFCCRKLSRFDVDGSNTNYSSEDGALFNKDKTRLVAYPGGKTGEYTVPGGVISIETGAFASNSNLTGITIPASVTGIGSGAFEGCGHLTDVYYGGYMRQWNAIAIGENNEPLTGMANIHYMRVNILTLPSHLTSIESEAFADLPGVDAISVPDTVTSIDNDAFDPDVVIIAPAGSYAETWAKDQGFTVINP